MAKVDKAISKIVHFDTKQLYLLQNQKPTDQRDYLFFVIGDYSHKLHPAILPEHTATSAANLLLHNVIECCMSNYSSLYKN
ncbi:hypothetical protein NM96_04150 [Neisseria mucosa]|nr:hypothetical protein NM96_04150 [Neisseria mucosa]KJJ19981.1 hypothetical protein HMPREF3156_00579 [Neisseria sp. HMSC06F02]